MRILVVEDERAIVDFLERGLGAEGYEVIAAHDGIEGERMALEEDPDLIILDRALPGREGLQVLRRLRAEGLDLPVVVLTARGEIEDRVEGLDSGATDYVTKPFSFAELTARIRARLREGAAARPTLLEAEGIRLDLVARRVEHAGVSVALSAREFDLLTYFVRHPRRVLTRQEILRAVWRYDHDPGTNVVQVYVGYLRRKLALPDRPAPLETVRSVGYRLAAGG